MMMAGPRVVDPTWGTSETARYRGLLKKLDRAGSPLWKAVRNAEPAGLGPYFEVLVRTWLEEVPPATLTAANWQVFAGPRTIGEFDLLFERDRQMWHWELALKFYLGHPAPDGQFRWFGPKPKDRLDRKWAKMRGQQLRLHRHPATDGALDLLGIERELNPRAFIKGYVFVPVDESFDVDVPPDLNPEVPRGWWVHRRDLAGRRQILEPDEPMEWMVLPEMRWMSPAFVTDQDRLVSFEALKSVVPPDTPTLVAGLTETDRGMREVTRGFVVPDEWPYFEVGRVGTAEG